MSMDSASSLNLSGLNEIINKMQECYDNENKISNELSSAMESRAAIYNKIQNALVNHGSSSTSMNTLHSHISNLTTIVKSSASSASALSSHVLALDICQSRVKSSLDRVGFILSIRAAIADVEKALEANDLNKAATLIQKANTAHRKAIIHHYRLKKNNNGSNDSLGSAAGSQWLGSGVHLSDDSAIETLNHLTTIVTDKVLLTIKENEGRSDISDQEKFKKNLDNAKILGKIGLRHQGIITFSKIVRSMLENKLVKSSLTLESQPKNAVLNFPDLFVSIFDVVMGYMKSHVGSASKTFGSGSQIRLLQEISQSVDVYVCPIIARFVQDKQIDKYVLNLRSLNSNTLNSNNNNNNQSKRKGNMIEGAVLDGVLEETSFVCHEIQMYDLALRHLSKTATKALITAANQDNLYYHQGEADSKDDSNGKENLEEGTKPKNSSDVNENNNLEDESSQNLNNQAAVFGMMELKDTLSNEPFGIALAHVTSLNKAAQELASHYIQLEDYYMTSNVQKAIQLDDHTCEPDGDDLINSSSTNAGPASASSTANEHLRTLGALASGVVTGSVSFPSLASAGSGANANSADSLSLLLISGVGSGLGISAMSGINTSGSANSTLTASSSMYGVTTSFINRFSISITSTVVDDSFYILKKCLERAFSTCYPDGAASVINHVNSCLMRDLIGYLNSIVSEYEQKYTTAINAAIAAQSSSQGFGVGVLANLAQSLATSSANAVAQQLATKHKDDERLLLAANNADSCVTNLSMLKKHLEAELDAGVWKSINDNFLNHSEPNSLNPQFNPCTIIHHCLSQIDDTSNSFKQVCSKATDLMLTAIIPRVRPHFDAIANLNFDITQSQYAERDHNDPTVPLFIQCVNDELVRLRDCLSPFNFMSLLSLFVSHTCTKLENLVFTKKFNLWGGMQLDKEIRKLSTYFSNLVDQSMSNFSNQLTLSKSLNNNLSKLVNVRDKFIRLVQMCTILSLDRANELLDYWGSNSNEVWRLSETQVKKILALRVDFSSKEINQLRL